MPSETLDALTRINTAIVEADTTDSMLERVLDEILDIFGADRAWLVYPCDPTAAEISVVKERTLPDWPGAAQNGGVIRLDSGTRSFLEVCAVSDAPVCIDIENRQDAVPFSDAARRFGVKSQMALPFRPRIGEPYILGIHHCAGPKTYASAAPLFQAIGNRLADGLATLGAMENLRRSEERFRALVDRATEAIMILDVDRGVFIEANPAAARLFRVSTERLFDARGPDALNPEYQPDGRRSDEAAAGYIRQALAGEFPRFEWVHLDGAGQPVDCDISLVRLPDPKRNLVRASLTDITERKRQDRERRELETRLAQSQKLEAVGQMTGGVAHDFNNLLNVILGNLELLRDQTDRPDALGSIDAAIDATVRGAELTHKMLAFARRAHLQPAVLDLNAVLREMDNWMRRTLPATISVVMELDDALWPVEADRASTESAILNLIINARDAMPEGGTLTVRTENVKVDGTGAREPAPGAYARLTVRDTGEGIGRDALDRVFEPFFTTKAHGSGSGLGLSMVHGFMKQSGGATTIQSTPGRGTTVSLYFAARAGAPDKAEGASGDSPGLRRGAPRILIAEDQPDVRNVLLRILRAAGYEVEPAESGDRACEIFREDGPYDLLITDIVMPGRLQGPALARELREDVPDLPVIFMSGYATEAAMHGNHLRNGDIRLMKPVSRARLLAAVEAALG